MRRNELVIVPLASALVPHAGGASAALIHLRRQAEVGGAEDTLYTVSLTLDPAPLFSVEKAVDFSGVLAPGYVHSLLATAEGSRFSSSRPVEVGVNGETTTDVAFSLAMVPEPSAAAAAASPRSQPRCSAAVGRFESLRPARRQNFTVSPPSNVRTLSYSGASQP